MSGFIAIVENSSAYNVDEANHIIEVEKLVHAVEFVNGIIESCHSASIELKSLSAKIINLDTHKVVVKSIQYEDALQIAASSDDSSLYANIPQQVMHRGITSFGVWYKD